MVQSHDFDPRVFDNPTEGQLQDRKKQLYPILSQTEKLRDFLKDVLALANSSRSLGRDAYILFGVDDHRRIVGIEGQDIKDPPRSEANLVSESDIEKFQGSLVGRILLTKISEYIGDFGASYEYGYIDGRLVSYLRIPGVTPRRWHERPYEITKPLMVSRKPILDVGYCMRRIGESNKVVEEKDKDTLYCYSTVPFIRPSEWALYCNNVITDVSHAILECNVTIPCSDEKNDVQEKDTVKYLLECISTGSFSSAIVCNLPGSGKSSVLRSFTVRLAELLMGEARALESSGVLEEPSEAIPVYVSLYNYSYRHSGSIWNIILQNFRRAGIMNDIDEEQLKKLMRNKRLRFIILLDSVDEMANEDPDSKLAVHSFTTSVPRNIKILFGCRSNHIHNIPDHEMYTRIEILPIHERTLYAYLETIYPEITDLVNMFRFHPELYAICTRPLAATALGEYLKEIGRNDSWNDTGSNRRPIRFLCRLS